MSSASRLPGIYFETVAPPPPTLLPRMDIAAFVGFLPSGPIGLPFAVEDLDRFQEIFGEDQPLAWDGANNQMLLAQTPIAVRSFFRNGGRRCWVLRLANNAKSNAWVVPGLLRVDALGTFSAGSVQARSEGSWSDDLTVNATLLETPLPAGALDSSGPAPNVQLDIGDMVQLYYQSTQTWAFKTNSDARWFWFQSVQPGDIGGCAGSPPAAQPTSVTWLGPGTNTPVSFMSFCQEQGEMTLVVSRQTALSVPYGSWLQIVIGQRTMLMQVERVDASDRISNSSPPSPASPPVDESATLVSTLGWWVLDPSAAWSTNRANTVQVSVVEFELWAIPSGSLTQRISNLGFTSDHPRYWELLPTDATLYAPVVRPSTPPYVALGGDIDNPRFPLAGTGSTLLGLPLGMTALPNTDFAQPASMPGNTALDRDGLSNYDVSLFVDPHLSTSTVTTLLQDAFYMQYQATTPMAPTGLYALLSVDEPSMVAVPDATLNGWSKKPMASAILAPPDPLIVSQPNADGNYKVSWTTVAGATGYLLQESADLSFKTQVTQTDVGAVTSSSRQKNPDCPLELYYRVSAYGTAGASPWSITGSVELGNGDFVSCSQKPVQAPILSLLAATNYILLEWVAAPGGADGFTLEIGEDPLFRSPRTLYQGTQTEFRYSQVPGPPVFFRVSAQRDGAASPWSNTVNTVPEPFSPWLVNQPLPGQPIAPLMLPTHAAMVRMAAARADMVAILSLPLSYRNADAAAYPGQLANVFNASEPQPGRILSYGAIYHPWLVVTDNTNPPPLSLRTVAPDGGVCGAIAAEALSSGAWIAPANVELNNIVDLLPKLTDGAPSIFDANQVNLIAQRPEGFLIMSQYTLADPSIAADVVPLNVRRLLILIRRLALREGVSYVFQNISATFQRQVTRQWEGWMQQLLERGAFAGLSAADSYRVIADQTVNTQASIDQGRFIVRLQIAPSVPMRFLTVQLMQIGGQLSLVES